MAEPRRGTALWRASASAPSVLVASAAVLAAILATWLPPAVDRGLRLDLLLQGAGFVVLVVAVEVAAGAALAVALPRRGPLSDLALATCAFFAAVPLVSADLVAAAMPAVVDSLGGGRLQPVAMHLASEWCSTAFAAAWRGVPLVAVLACLGLRGCPRALEHAAFADGASRWLRFRLTLLPRLWPMLAFAAALRLVDVTAAVAAMLRRSPESVGPATCLALAAVGAGGAGAAFWLGLRLRARTSGGPR